MTVLFKRSALIILLFSLFYCSDNSLSVAGDITDARQKWVSRGIDDYSFHYNRSCFCPWASVTFKVDVKAGEIVAAIDTAGVVTVQEGDLQYFYTIDALFDLLEDADKENVASLEYVFNKDFGYPEHISVDYDKQIADDEVSFQVNLITTPKN